tara:strand:- start:500 stop:1468 length:969 start_codon:yes stop_codon:yes gene_type:complete
MNLNKKETILITGGFGYLGTFLTNLLLKKNYKVVVVDNLCNGKKFKKKNLIHINKKFSSDIVANYIKKKNIKKIIHLAAYIDAEESVKNPTKYFKNNVIEFKKFLENIKDLKLNKIIFASSAAVYGNGSKNKISESFEIKPMSPYGLSKYQGEELLNYFSKKYLFSSYCLRFFNIAGANIKIGCGPFNSSYNHIFNILLKKKIFFINGIDYSTIDGTCIRDYVNVSDVSEVILRLLKLKETDKKNHIFNCGSGKGTSVKSIANEFKNKVKSDLIVKIGKRRAGDPTSIISNNLKIKKLIQIKFKNSHLKQILKEYNEWNKNK